MTSILWVDQVSKSFQTDAHLVHAVDKISLAVTAGEFVVILGPSGSGKSTLLRILGGLLQPDLGNVWFRQEPLVGPQKEIGFVFQKTNLMPWRTVLQNVLLPVEIQEKEATKADQTRACELLDLVGLNGFDSVYSKTLSGGMAQRVVLARSLMQQPQLLLMDEPFGALDSLTRERLNMELLRIQKLQSNTIVLVTHSISEAVLLADRVLILTNRPGRIKTEVAIDLPRPRTLAMIGTEKFGQLTTKIRRSIGSV